MSEPLEYLHVSENDPGEVGAGSIWIDISTTPPTLNIRNTANDGWAGNIALGGGTVEGLAQVDPAIDGALWNNAGDPAISAG